MQLCAITREALGLQHAVLGEMRVVCAVQFIYSWYTHQ